MLPPAVELTHAYAQPGKGRCAMAESAPPTQADPSEGADNHLLFRREGLVAVVQINRPRVRNALNEALLTDLVAHLESLDSDLDIRVLVLTGDERAFVAGADIAEMAGLSSTEMAFGSRLTLWNRLGATKKPLIAAVSGYALGGGNELAMACDMVVAGESAQFGQPEINLGIIPGAGGTQRLVRAIGKARAMELVLTGRLQTANEAFALGLITKVVPDELY